MKNEKRNGIARSVFNLTRSNKVNQYFNHFPSIKAFIGSGIVFLFLLGSGCRQNKDRWLEIESKVENLEQAILPGTDPEAGRIRDLVFNGLTARVGGEGAKQEIAENVRSEDGDKRFIIKLRPGIRFHNDQRLSSLDVRYTFIAVINSELSRSEQGEQLRSLIESIEVRDALTIVFNCFRATPEFVKIVGQVGIIPEGSLAVQAKQLVGTGPYRFLRRMDRNRLLLAKNDHYWQ